MDFHCPVVKNSMKMNDLPGMETSDDGRVDEGHPSGTVAAGVYDRIKQDIIFGRLAPGSKLKLDAMRRQYGVSISTIRETLRRLATEGFVLAAEQRGFFVTDVSAEDLTEVANLRILLECSALRTSVQTGDAHWEADLVAAHHLLSRAEQRMLAGDHSQKEQWKNYDSAFHHALIKACRSRNLMSLHAILFDKYLRYQMLILTYRGQEAVDEHKAIFDAALARDVDAASNMLETHITKGLQHTLAAL